jgi:hypothetical protein
MEEFSIPHSLSHDITSKKTNKQTLWGDKKIKVKFSCQHMHSLHLTFDYKTFIFHFRQKAPAPQ